ncbi:hypothetical protein JNJ66_07340 [Candidatus Saccharibacteria bacterium]|nr:hypothetical protein [Candidatus Saccharibacteria bacterium]
MIVGGIVLLAILASATSLTESFAAIITLAFLMGCICFIVLGKILPDSCCLRTLIALFLTALGLLLLVFNLIAAAWNMLALRGVAGPLTGWWP